MPTLAGRLRALIGPAELAADDCAATAATLPAPWWAAAPTLMCSPTTELAVVDYLQPGGLTWQQLSQLTSAALATQGCAGWLICI